MSSTTQLVAAANGTAAKSDHPTIVRVMAQADKFAEAMPKVMTKDRFMRIAIGAIRRNPKLLECDPLSLMGTLLVAAQLGLEVNTPLGHFYLIPRFNRHTNRMEADGQIGYKGWVELLNRTGVVKDLIAHTVHEKDEFEYELGDNEHIRHKPAMGDRGKAIAFYVIVKLTNGGVRRRVLSRYDVEKYRARSKTPNAGPWVSDYDAMALKTTFLREVPWLPLSLELRSAVSHENAIEANATLRYSEASGQIDYRVPEVIEQLTSPVEVQTTYDDETDDTVDHVRSGAGPDLDNAKPGDRVTFSETQERRDPAVEALYKERTVEKPKRQTRKATTVETTAQPVPPVQQQQPQQQAAPTQSAPTQAAKPFNHLAMMVKAIEGYIKEAAAAHDQDGLPELSKPAELMPRLYRVIQRDGHVSDKAVNYYSQANEIARLADDEEGIVRVLTAANKVVRDEYAGVPFDDDEPESMTAPAPAQGQANPVKAALSNPVAENVARLEKWLQNAAAQFEAEGQSSYAHPGAVLSFCYDKFKELGFVAGVATSYRPKTQEIAAIEADWSVIRENLKTFATELMNDLTAPPPE